MRIVAISSVLSHLARKDFKSSFLCSASVPPSCVQRHGAWVSPVNALGDSQHCHTTKLAPIKQARTNKQGVDMLNCVFQSNIGGAMYNMFQKLSTVLKGNYAYRVGPRPGSSPMHLSYLGFRIERFHLGTLWVAEAFPLLGLPVRGPVRRHAIWKGNPSTAYCFKIREQTLANHPRR